jgi:hypothetical protein
MSFRKSLPSGKNTMMNMDFSVAAALFQISYAG